MSPVENTFAAVRTMAQFAFPCAPASMWRDDPIEATQRASARLGLGVLAQTEAMHNALMNSLLLSGRWALSAYPVFQLTHRLAATLMATTISEDALEDVRCPFYSVTVRVPENLIFIAGQDDHPEPAALLMFSSYMFTPNQRSTIEGVEHPVQEPRWSYCLSTNPTAVGNGRKDGLSVWAYHVPQSKILDGNLPRTWNELPRTSMDDRADILARRLMFGICLWCSDPKNLGEPQRSRNPATAERGRSGDQLPDFKLWSLGKDIKLDSNIIEAVRSFSREGGSSPKVQSLVSGHWKRQAHGPGRRLRKLVHVAPYWRGPLDAPVISHGGR